MFQATNRIYNALIKEGIKATKHEINGASLVETRWNIDMGGGYTILFANEDNDNDTTVGVISLLNNIPEDKTQAILIAINVINQKYRFFKFYLDSDRDIRVEYDFLVNSDPADGCVEICHRIAKIIDEVYPIFMKVLYS